MRCTDSLKNAFLRVPIYEILGKPKGSDRERDPEGLTWSGVCVCVRVCVGRGGDDLHMKWLGRQF